RLEMLMYSYSGITNYFDDNGKATINDPKHVEFLQKYLIDAYVNYTAEDDLTKSWTELSSAFQSGGAGFVVHNLGSDKFSSKLFEYDTTKFAAAPFPERK